jgi:hypothetical protein
MLLFVHQFDLLFEWEQRFLRTVVTFPQKHPTKLFRIKKFRTKTFSSKKHFRTLSIIVGRLCTFVKLTFVLQSGFSHQPFFWFFCWFLIYLELIEFKFDFLKSIKTDVFIFSGSSWLIFECNEKKPNHNKQIKYPSKLYESQSM